ncbi:MAG TPA: hypothetical protein VIV11_23015 [Kofleriaceae bacterium]
MRLGFGSIALAFLVGCIKPTYSFEPRPLLPPPATETERCYQDARFEIAAASGSYKSMQSSTYVVSTATSYSIVGSESYDYQGESGLVLYRGGKRLDVRESLRELRDPAVDQEYARVLGPTESAYRSHPMWRALSVGTTVVSSGVVLGATGWAMATGFSDTRPLYVMLAGTGGLLVSLIPTVATYLTRDKHYLHERKLKFFHDRAFAPTLAAGVRNANQRVAATCNHAPADVPITARAAALNASAFSANR